jgi:hypothetical protein
VGSETSGYLQQVDWGCRPVGRFFATLGQSNPHLVTSLTVCHETAKKLGRETYEYFPDRLVGQPLHGSAKNVVRPSWNDQRGRRTECSGDEREKSSGSHFDSATTRSKLDTSDAVAIVGTHQRCGYISECENWIKTAGEITPQRAERRLG